MPREPPITRREFEEKNRRMIVGARDLPDADLFAWQRGRDWLAERVAGDPGSLGRRRSPRLRLTLPVHIAGVGGGTTDDLGFYGLALRPRDGPALRPGDDASVRVVLLGRSIYAIARVAWMDSERVGLVLSAIHPGDARALQAAVCDGLLDLWVEP